MLLKTKARTGFRAIAAVAVATVAGSLVAAAPTAAHTDTAKGSTSISIRVAPQKIEAGDDARVLGNLNVKGPAFDANRTVTLEAKAEGETGFTAVGEATSGPNGKLRVDVTPDVSTRYRWYFAGAEDARPRRSGVARIVVGETNGGGNGRLTTSLSIRAPHRLVDADGNATVVGRLRSHRYGVPHRRVLLLSRTAESTGWTLTGRQLTDGHGRVSFVTAQDAKKTAYRLKFWGDRVFKPSRSGVVRVGVRPVVTIAATPNVINPGETSEVSGVATYDGLPLVGATVELKSRKARSNQKFGVTATGVTGPDGSVAFPVAPTRDTVYRLVVVRTADYPRGVSPAAKVNVRSATSLSIRGVDKPNGFRVSGALRGDGSWIKGALVTLMAKAPDSTEWTEVGSARTVRKGFVKFLVPTSEGTSYQLSFAGNRRFAPSSSGIVID